MKRGREDEKIMGPMFPRLHVNDADKGGPRAPPRNKMALYEQLSIPSQRCSHSVVQRNTNNAARDSIPHSSRGHDSERGMYFSHQVAREHQPSKHYMLYSDMSIPSQQFELRKKLDEDDYTVPNFIQAGQGQECSKTNNDRHHGRLSSKNVSYLNHQLKFGIGKGTEDSSQEGINPSTECSKTFVGAKTKAVPGSAQKIDVPGSNQSHSIDRSKAGNNLRTDIFAESQHSVEVTTTVKSNSSNSHEASPSENQNGLHGHINDSESHEDGVCRSLQSKILEKGDGVSETSILDSVSGHDITADEVVAIIGQKHFWKARKAIANQQRVFAVQVFELHRLIKVQKLIAASPHLLLEDAACLGKALESLPGKALPLDYSSIKSLPVVSKQKVDLEKTSQRKEVPADSSIAKASLSSAQNGPLPSVGKQRLFSLAQNGSNPSSHQTLNGNNIPKTPSLNTEASARPWYLNQQQGHQWLIPVMSPSEGLVYKPYPAPGFMNQECNNYGPPGSIHVMGNFPPPPAYGIPTQPHQYQFPPYPHNYFPYGMPVMSTGAISGSSVDQVNPLSRPNLSNQTNRHTPSNVPNERKEAFQGSSNRPPMDVDVQASTASCPSERQRSSKVANSSMENRNVLTLFPMSPVKDDSDRIAEVQEKSERPPRVIKVVPHNATSVSESVARIIRSIEEGRQFDSA